MASVNPSKPAIIRMWMRHKHNLLVPMELAWRSEISHLAKLVYGRLRAYEGQRGEARPKIETLARELAVSRDSAARALKELVKFGLIVVTYRCSQGLPSIYEFTDHQWLKEATPPKPLSKSKRGSKPTPTPAAVPPLVLLAGQGPCLADKTSPSPAAVRGGSHRSPAGSPPCMDAVAEEVHDEQVHERRGSTARPLPDASRRAAASAASPTKDSPERPERPQRNARHALTPSSAAPLSAVAQLPTHPVAVAWCDCTGEMLTDEDVELLVADWDGNEELAAGWVRWVLSPAQLARLRREGRNAPIKLRPGWRPTPAWVSTLSEPNMSYRGEFLHEFSARHLVETLGWTDDDSLDVAGTVFPILHAHVLLIGREEHWPIETARKLAASLQRLADERDMEASDMTDLLEQLPKSATPEIVTRYMSTLVALVLDHDLTFEQAESEAKASVLPVPAATQKKRKGKSAKPSTARRRAR